MIPDWSLLAALGRQRGKGRDDYPVHVLCGVHVLSVALRQEHDARLAAPRLRR